MRASPITMALLYFSIGVLLIFFAIQNVNTAGWNFWSYLIVSFAAIDFMIAYRFYRLRKVIKQLQKTNKKKKD
ncbi:YdiK family protein [Halalkalibacter alkaliphilus]|uniref:YdiK family protein n=1 Tax=Halalkalibacter alkaliphilus TaxID=2917993 RepID=A0A9X2CVE2_9BACI|nr:YdiK family protein [Halalkalibacter alkaliphilus]MCL7748835.1 YdiK family protein [Halalkalibacter alkaliphilus]